MPDVDEILRDLGRSVRSARSSKSWTLRELATASGLSVRFLHQLETGVGNISVRKLAQVAEALETSADQLLRAPRRAIALVGMRGAGKSTVGALLSKRLKVPLVEIDREVEVRAGLTLSELFSLHGEAYYRRLEREALSDTFRMEDVRRKGAILATGGSLVTDAETYALLKENAVTVWLRARPEEHFDRVASQGDRRPMAGRANALDELTRLLDAREPLYREADLTIETTGVSPDEIAKSIRSAVRSTNGTRATSRRSAA